MSAEYNAKFANTDIATRAIHAGQEALPLWFSNNTL